jgi:RHS repeat-associated protein
VDADGDNSGDYNQINTWIGLTQYHTQGDVNMDGVLDSADASLAMATDGTAAGRGVMSTAAVASRKGYAGYENDGVVSRFSHVRHRVLDSLLGRWTRRDPAGYVDGTHLMVFGRSNSIRWMDPTGWLSQSSDWNLCVEISLDYASCLECCPSGFALTFGPSCKETCRSKYLLTPVIPIPDYKLPNLIIPSRPTWPPYELPPRRIGPDPERFLPPEQDHRCILFRVVAHPDGTFSIECMVDIPF